MAQVSVFVFYVQLGWLLGSRLRFNVYYRNAAALHVLHVRRHIEDMKVGHDSDRINSLSNFVLLNSIDAGGISSFRNGVVLLLNPRF